MSALSALAARLAKTTETATQNFSESLVLSARTSNALATIKKVIKELEGGLNGLGGDRPPQDRVREAVIRFRQDFLGIQSGTSTTIRSDALQYVCYGITDKVGVAESILENTKQLELLLQTVPTTKSMPRNTQLRRCYFGLLCAYWEENYFAGTEQDAPEKIKQYRKNWETLRAFLQTQLPNAFPAIDPDAKVGPIVPALLVNLQKHSNLLGEDPCKRYVDEDDGDGTLQKQLQRDLMIPDRSWVIYELVIARMDDLIESPNERLFINRIQWLLTTLDQHPAYIHSRLTRILERYRTIQSTENMWLREFSIRHWGIPWLNPAAWSRVTEGTREMVATWLKKNLIETFFSSMLEDQRADHARIAFWKQYASAIQDMYFVLSQTGRGLLGAEALESMRKAGRLKIMSDSVVNAFVMVVYHNGSRKVVVEFSHTGHAASLYHMGDIDPQKLHFMGANAVTPADCRRSGIPSIYRVQMVHRDGWQSEFSSKLNR